MTGASGPGTSDATIEERVAALDGSLSPQERALAEVMLDHLSELAVYRAGELAELAGVSKATVSRFVRRLGFADWAAVRANVTARRAAGTPIGAVGAPAGSADGAAVVL
ncbi:MurR/RpiR family transcriptional regulator, partial [Agromyces seonyuensis]